MEHSDIYDLITEADGKRDEIVLCLLGAPGIGKTQHVYDWARDHGRDVVEIIASQILPNEVSGITMPVESSHSMEIYDHARLSSLKDGDILFFDELLQAAPTTLSACLTLIQERRLMSGKKLPDVLIIAAANNIASASMIPLSIRQRFMFYNCIWNRDKWKEYIDKEFRISIGKDLIDLVKVDGDRYNVLTPRTATKLLSWYIESSNKSIVFNAIQNMFDSYTAETIKRNAENKASRTMEEQIVDAVSKWYRDRSMFEFDDRTMIKINKDNGHDDQDSEEYTSIEELRDCNAEELLEILQRMPDWDIISRMLSRIEAE